jgi:polysaccharide biosynthesis/export protein
MKAVKFSVNLALSLAMFSVASFGQTENPPVNLEKKEQTEIKAVPTETPKTAAENQTTAEAKPETKTEQPSEAKPSETPVPTSEEEVQISSYYNNYLSEYRLGPNDVITVEVFGQCPDYCKQNITVPPTARISYPLIREGVMVGGKTVEQIADEITKKLDEYIIEPKVTVTLDKAMSVRYSVMGKVTAPGIRVMDRKVSLYEAIIEAGGIAKDGNKKKIALIRFDAQGKLSRQDVNLTEIETGKVPMIFLSPGDQVFVSGKGFTLEKVFDYIGKFGAARLLLGGL